MEWDCLVDEAVSLAMNDVEERKRTEPGSGADGLLVAVPIGPQADRDPAMASADWRKRAPEGTAAREEADAEEPVTPHDGAYQAALRTTLR